MGRIQWAVALNLAAAIGLHAWTRDARTAPLPLVASAALLLMDHFHPKVRRDRLGIVPVLRISSVAAAYALWSAGVAWVAILVVRGLVEAAGWNAGAIQHEELALYGPFVLPVALALKRKGPQLNDSCKLLVSLFYDTPMHAVVFAYASIGWRLNRLATPICAGEVLLGALPYSSDAAWLRSRGVTGVVNLCKEWQGPVERYAALGMEQLRIPTTDGDMPTLTDAVEAVRFIRRHVAAGGRVFVHCRCGVGRSATIALCYLISECGMHPDDAVEHLRVARPEVSAGIAKYTTVRSFAASASVEAASEPDAAASREAAAVPTRSSSAPRARPRR